MSAAQITRDSEDTSPSEDTGRAQRPRRRGRAAAVMVVVLVVAAGAGVMVTGPFDARTKNSSSTSTAPPQLAQVTKGTLSARTQENGTLGYAGDYQVVNKASGTLTQLPSVGQVISQGKALYRVDGKPVILLYGAHVPIYRALSRDMEGPDVRQLNRALVSLGYASKSTLDPDSDYFGWQTYKSLKKLQDDVGQKTTGKLDLGQAVFVPAKQLRITKVSGVLGGSLAPGAMPMQASSTDRQVTVSLSASQQSDVAVGDKVIITLPTGKTAPGVVASVGKVATKAEDSTTVDVLIKPSKPKETGQLDQAPVQVSIATDTAKDVLQVPVNSLLALAGGGYAVEAVNAAGKHTLIPVKPGLFDDSAGLVAVTGEGLQVGQKIVVPSS
jgi:hypothetical protein